MADQERTTTSGIQMPLCLDSASVVDLDKRLGGPGQFPYTRGVYPSMYRGRLWTMRQYAGFGTAEETNKRFKYLLDKGQTGLSVAFDLATQIGYDSDHPLARGEVGRTGVAIDSLEDMEMLLDGLPLDKVSTSMTINSTAIILLSMYIAVGKKTGVAPEQLMGTIQNDILKEFIARGTYIFPPKPSMRLITDIFSYASSNLSKFNTISISGYHIREAGSTAVQEIAFTLSNGIAYVKAALEAGLAIDEFAPRLSFFFASHGNLLEEVAKFRAARRIWAGIMKDKFEAKNEKSLLLRFHTQTGGSTLTAQQPENNIVRTTLQALSAVFGGTQSLHTNAFDEALALPTEKSAEIALRTQQILGYETGLADSVDPLAGSYLVEYLTDQMETKVNELMGSIEELGGSVDCVNNGYFRNEIGRAAYEYQKKVDNNSTVVVGVNKFQSESMEVPEVLKVDPILESHQVKRLNELRSRRDNEAVQDSLKQLSNALNTDNNLVEFVISAVENYATIGEISDCLRQEWGEFHESA